MKTIASISVIIIAVLFRTSALTAQEYRIAATNTKVGKLILEDFIGDLHLEGYEGEEIVFFKTSFDGDINSSTPKSANELNPSHNGLTDNSGIGLHIEKYGNQITASCMLSNIQISEYKVKVPNNFSIKIISDCERSKDIIVSDMRNEVEINNCQSIKLSNITGSIVLSAISGNIVLGNCALDKDATISIAVISGNIQAVISQINTKEPISINSISGNVVLTLPANIAANFTLKSISGIIKSEFDFPDEDKMTNQAVGTKIDYQTNGGGVEIKISTLSGNISLLKNK